MSLPLSHVAVGFLVTLVLGLFTGHLVRWAGRSVPKNPPPKATEEQKQQWKELTDGNEGGAFIGWIERFIFFAAFLVPNISLMAGAWLAFKVGSKWNAWTNITAVPKKIEEMDELDFAIGRRRWGSNVLVTFLVGTGFNLCAGMLGVAVAHKLGDLLKLVGY